MRELSALSCGFPSLSLEYVLFPFWLEGLSLFFLHVLREMHIDFTSLEAENLKSSAYSFWGSIIVLGYCPSSMGIQWSNDYGRKSGWRVWKGDCSVCAGVCVCVLGRTGRLGSRPIQHIWNIWGLEVCSNVERHSKTHKETFSPSSLFSRTSSSEFGTIFRRATDYFPFYEAFCESFQTWRLMLRVCLFILSLFK